MSSNVEDERLKQWLKVLQEPNAEMSKIAAEKLGDLKRKEAVPLLIEHMKERTALVAAACALALGKIGERRETFPALVHTLKNHQDVMVQTASAEALGELRLSEAVTHLKAVTDEYISTFKNDRFGFTRGMRRGLFTTCIYALRQIGTPTALRIAEQAERTDRE